MDKLNELCLLLEQVLCDLKVLNVKERFEADKICKCWL